MSAELHEAFWNACANGNLPKVQSLLPEIEDLDVRHPRGWTGLMMACHGAHSEVARLLVEAGADLNAVNSKGTTVLMYAKTPVFESADTTLLVWLIERGARLNAIDIHGKSVLDYVCERQDEDLARFFRNHGAMPGGQR